jgi:hypothetical protein
MITIFPASGVSFVRLQHRTNVETSVFAKAVTDWTVAFLLSSFATTIYSTGNPIILSIWMKANVGLMLGLIAYKMMSTQLELRRHGISTSGSLVHRILRIIVESAALYSLNHLLYAVLYEVKTQVESTPSFLVSIMAESFECPS